MKIKRVPAVRFARARNLKANPNFCSAGSHISTASLRQRYATRNGETLFSTFRAYTYRYIDGIHSRSKRGSPGKARLVMARYGLFWRFESGAKAIRFPPSALKSLSTVRLVYLLRRTPMRKRGGVRSFACPFRRISRASFDRRHSEEARFLVQTQI